ncbi:MAG: polysaccharide biosynthesis/export family protein [Bacteroidota bacterium]|nr:polysaccharide biosynthesis/export family protein [Bacteroidota bacterium]
MKQTINKISLIVLICLMASSCVPIKKMVYLQSENDFTDKVFEYNKTEYRLQVNDIVDVQVRSMNDEANKLFSVQMQGAGQTAQAGVQSGGDLYYMSGYTIDQDGNIELPFMDTIHVLGLTLKEAQAAIDKKVSKLFKNYFLQVKLGGIRFSTLGEFNNGGKHVILQNQATIYEAISLAGDLTPLAKRDEIRLIRQYPEGTKVHTINLLDQSIIGSPYYFIQPSDVLYAEPLPQKAYGFGVTGAQTITTLVSALSSSLALYLTIISLGQ